MHRDLGITSKASTGTCACGGVPGACACGHGHPSSASGRREQVAGQDRRTLAVTGMTCGHCVASVTEELTAVAGVAGVEVDLRAGGVSAVTVALSRPVDTEALQAAVEEAGYRLAPA